MVRVLARNWWALALRGLAAFIWPGLTLTVLVLLFGAYALVDGVFALIAALRAARQHGHSGALLLEAVLNIIIAIICFVWPAESASLKSTLPVGPPLRISRKAPERTPRSVMLAGPPARFAWCCFAVAGVWGAAPTTFCFEGEDFHAAITSAVTSAMPTSAAMRTLDCTRRCRRGLTVRRARIGASSSPTT